MNLTEYQRDLVHGNWHREIMITGRQAGKTETCIRVLRERMDRGEISVLLSSQVRMLDECMNRLRERCEESDSYVRSTKRRVFGTGAVYGLSTSGPMDLDIDTKITMTVDQAPDVIVVDEAQMVPEECLFVIDREFPEADVLLTETPLPETRSVLDVWAESSPYWNVTHVPSTEAPFINSDWAKRFMETMSRRKKRFEIDAVYEREDR